MSNSLTIGSAVSLHPLGIPWEGPPNKWNTIPRHLLSYCTVQGKVMDNSNNLLYTLSPIKSLGSGTFGTVELYKCSSASGEDKVTQTVAVKRPNDPSIDLLMEALFQWRVHNILSEFGLSFCIPEVYSIFRFRATGDIWFSMKAYSPVLLSFWCVSNAAVNDNFIKLMLQISLILEVMESEIKMDHRDLKVNNIIVVDEPVNIHIQWEGKKKTISFPFHVIFLDFGYACAGGIIDIKSNDGLPPIDLCPKVGRDIFQILVSLWRIEALRSSMDKWNCWIRSRIEKVEPAFSYIRLVESSKDLNWMYSVTEDRNFRAPLCAPRSMIRDCIHILEC
jgi:serine/threonine protein kinase